MAVAADSGYERLGVEPDAYPAKGLGGGHAIGALLVKKSVDHFVPGDHASTFGGNPFTCRAGLTVARELQRRDLISNVQQQGDQPSRFECLGGALPQLQNTVDGACCRVW